VADAVAAAAAAAGVAEGVMMPVVEVEAAAVLWHLPLSPPLEVVASMVRCSCP